MKTFIENGFGGNDADDADRDCCGGLEKNPSERLGEPADKPLSHGGDLV